VCTEAPGTGGEGGRGAGCDAGDRGHLWRGGQEEDLTLRTVKT
jgi:hypothetical protein